MTAHSPDTSPNTSPGSDDEIGVWLLRFMADDAADGRARVETWRRRSDESATLVGVLTDIAESGRSVEVSTIAGNTYIGRVEHVADAVVVIETENRQLAVIRTSAIAAVVPERGFRVPGEGVSTSTRSFRAVIDAVIEPGDVLTVIAGGSSIIGEFISCGQEVLLMRAAMDRTVYLALEAIGEISVAANSGWR
jgi:hypothetical protein